MTNTISNLKSLEDMFGVTILLAKITGRRWASKGHSVKKIPIAPSKKIQFNTNNGVIVYNWFNLEKEVQIELERKLFELGAN